MLAAGTDIPPVSCDVAAVVDEVAMHVVDEDHHQIVRRRHVKKKG